MTVSPKRATAVLLQGMIVLLGIGVLAFLLVEPHFEGRNAQATFFEVYFHDPFLAYVYLGSIALFVGLYHAFRLVGRIGQQAFVSPQSVWALRTIQRCALVLVAFIIGAEAFLFLMQRGTGEDIAGGVAMGILAMLLSLLTATVASVLKGRVQRAVALHTERIVSA